MPPVQSPACHCALQTPFQRSKSCCSQFKTLNRCATATSESNCSQKTWNKIWVAKGAEKMTSPEKYIATGCGTKSRDKLRQFTTTCRKSRRTVTFGRSWQDDTESLANKQEELRDTKKNTSPTQVSRVCI